jgi:hypothetical protein
LLTTALITSNQPSAARQITEGELVGREVIR